MQRALGRRASQSSRISKATARGPFRPLAGDNWICKTVQHVIKLLCWTGSQFSSIISINVINVTVSADRAMLDNKIEISFDFFISFLCCSCMGVEGKPGEGDIGWMRGCPLAYVVSFCGYYHNASTSGKGGRGHGSLALLTSVLFILRHCCAHGGTCPVESGSRGSMCQLLKPLLIKADSKQIPEIQPTAGKHKSNLELSSCEIGPSSHSWGWERDWMAEETKQVVRGGHYCYFLLWLIITITLQCSLMSRSLLYHLPYKHRP